jgi:hypothetical protein
MKIDDRSHVLVSKKVALVEVGTVMALGTGKTPLSLEIQGKAVGETLTMSIWLDENLKRPVFGEERIMYARTLANWYCRIQRKRIEVAKK